MNRQPVLIIEDDPALRDLLVSVVERYGFETDAVEGGRAGIARLASKHYAAVLLDLLMPEVNGIDVLQYIRAWRPEWLRRVIVTTALSSMTIERLPERDELAAVFSKPFNVPDLMAALQVCVNRSVLADGGVGESFDEPAGRFFDGSRALGAENGLLGVIRGSSLGLVTTFGLSESQAMRHSFIPLSAAYPICDCLRSGEAVYLPDVAAADARYQPLQELWAAGATRSVAAIPVRCGDEIVGAVGWCFGEVQPFDAAQRRELAALAGRCPPWFALCATR